MNTTRSRPAGPSPRRGSVGLWGLLLKLGVLALVVAAGFIPYKYEIGGECRITPADERGLRALLDDEIADVLVTTGQQVEPGALIATLSARDEEARVLATRAQLAQAQARLDLLVNGARPEDIAIAEHDVKYHEDQVALLKAGARPEEIAIAQHEVDYYQYELDLLVAGSRPEEISIARQEVEFQHIQVAFSQVELDRTIEMAENGAATKQDLEKAQRTLEANTQKYMSAKDALRILEQGTRPEEVSAAKQKLEGARKRLSILQQGARLEEVSAAEQLLLGARERLSLIKAGAREEEVRAAKAELEGLQAQLAHEEKELALREIRTPIQGIVVTTNLKQRIGQAVLPGDLIAVVQDTTTVACEVAATEAASVRIEPGQKVKIRLVGLDGGLFWGTVRQVIKQAITYEEFTAESIRSDRENQFDRSRENGKERCVRVIVDVDPAGVELSPGMSGYANIVIGEDCLWRAVCRPILRYARVEVWSWLP